MTGGSGPRVVLTGGTGFTGGLVAAELRERGLPILLTGRDPARLARAAAGAGDPPTAVVDVTRPGTLSEHLTPGDVVANFAGPFTRLGEPVVRAAVEADAHYLDTTGEQRFMKAVADRWDGPARDRGVAVVNAMAFEYALGDAACALAAGTVSSEAAGEAAAGIAVDVTYSWGGPSSGTSPGTRASVLEVLGSRGLAYEDGEWREEPVAARRRRARMPDGRGRPSVSFPSGEVVTAGRAPEVVRVRGWLVTGRALAATLSVLGPVLPPVARVLRPVLEPIIRRAGPEEPSLEARDASRFTIVAEARSLDDGGTGGARVAVQGRDPYGITARLVARASAALLGSGPEPAVPAGVVRPSAVLGPRRLLEEEPDVRCVEGAAAEGL